MIKIVSEKQIEKALDKIADQIYRIKKPKDFIVGIARGGIIPAYRLYTKYCIGTTYRTIDAFDEKALEEFRNCTVVMIDDIYDTGATINYFVKKAKEYNINLIWHCLVEKTDQNDWFKFPWETKSDEEGGREQAVISLLRSIKEDPLREGLKGTPGRVNRAYDEIFAGYGKTASDVLTTSFASEAYDEMVILKDIEFYSMCEHHILPFYGRVAFAYIPDGKVVGVSKISRLIEIYSRRLQIQERMTMQIGKEFEGVMSPKGVAVVVEGVHLCMLMRGVKKENATMITSYMGGIFREKIEARNEFLALIGDKK